MPQWRVLICISLGILLQNTFVWTSIVFLSRDHLGLWLALAGVLCVVSLLCQSKVVVPLSAAEAKRVKDAVGVAALAHAPIVAAVLRVAGREAWACYAAAAFVLRSFVPMRLVSYCAAAAAPPHADIYTRD